MADVRITEGQIPAVRAKMAKQQGDVCALCGLPFTSKDGPALDHSHVTGHVRGVLHRSCNGVEGRILKLAQRATAGLSPVDYIIGLAAYYQTHATPQTQLIHPDHLDDNQKREKANAARRTARARAKAPSRPPRAK